MATQNNDVIPETYMPGAIRDVNDELHDDDLIVRDLVDINTPLDRAIQNANMPRIQLAIERCLELDLQYKPAIGPGFYERAEALYRIYKAHASGYLVTRLGDPRPDRILNEGCWVRPTTWQREHQRVGLLIKGKFHCDPCALEEKLTFPAAFAVYPSNILPYSQTCCKCGKLVVSGLRKSDGSGDYLELFEQEAK